MVLKLGVKRWGLDLYKVYLNDNPGMTLAYFKARSNLVADVFESGHLVGKTSRRGPVF